MSPTGGIFAPIVLGLIRHAVREGGKMLRTRAINATRAVNNANVSQAEPAVARVTARQPIHPAAVLRQQRAAKWASSRSFSTAHGAVRRWLSTGIESLQNAQGEIVARSRPRGSLPSSKTSRAVGQFTGRAPFACSLRPNLTGGAMPRTAGGYSLGGAGNTARYFSHTPQAPAQVVQQVHAAIRGFFVQGHRARFDGVDAKGNPRFRTISAAQDRVTRAVAAVPRSVPGAYVDFKLAPTVTALSPLAAAFPFAGCGNAGVPAGLAADGFLDDLAVDLGRAAKELKAVMADVRRLAALGDLPISLEKGSVLRVRFPGVDAGSVDAICDDLGLTRGVVRQDPDFEERFATDVALRFPYAPDAGGDRTITSPGGSLRSLEGSDLEEAYLDQYPDLEEGDNRWLSGSEDLEGYESASPIPTPTSSRGHHSEDFEGLEGIYRFIEECERAKAQYQARS